MKKNTYKKLSLFDLAAIRVKNADKPVYIHIGDLIEIIEPFVKGENYLGTVINFTESTMSVYHAEIRKEIIWNRRVNALVHMV